MEPEIEGVQTDPVTYLLYSLGNRFEALEDERALQSGTQLLDFSHRPGERIDALLTRFDLARHEADIVGAGIHNFHQLSTILLRAVRITGNQLVNLLQPFGGRVPNTQQQFDTMVNQLRSMGHIYERAPGNVASTLGGSHQHHNAHYTDIFNYDDVPTQDPIVPTSHQSSPQLHRPYPITARVLHGIQVVA